MTLGITPDIGDGMIHGITEAGTEDGMTRGTTEVITEDTGDGTTLGIITLTTDGMILIGDIIITTAQAISAALGMTGRYGTDQDTRQDQTGCSAADHHSEEASEAAAQ